MKKLEEKAFTFRVSIKTQKYFQKIHTDHINAEKISVILSGVAKAIL